MDLAKAAFDAHESSFKKYVEEFHALLKGESPNMREVENKVKFLKSRLRQAQVVHERYLEATQKENPKEFTTVFDKYVELEKELSSCETKMQIEQDQRNAANHPPPSKTTPESEKLKMKMDTLEQDILSSLKELDGALQDNTNPDQKRDVYHWLHIVGEQIDQFKLLHDLLIKLLINEDGDEYEKRSQTWMTMSVQRKLFESEVETKYKPPPTTPAPVEHSRFPKRELFRFGGNPRDWPGFNASFSEIDADAKLSTLEKFHLLLQSLVEGSEPHRMVKGFPLSEANYAPAFEQLQQRYGRDNVLIKVFVRDLLKLVMENTMGKRLSLSDLVNQLTSQLKNLSSLGVTDDKYAAILYPVVESCLAEETLVAWQRRPDHKEDLKALLEFLQQEVNLQTERRLAKSQFQYQEIGRDRSWKDSSSSSRNKTNENSSSLSASRTGGTSRTGVQAVGGKKSGSTSRTGENYGSSKKSTASALVAAEGRKTIRCIFCEEEHYASECHKAMGMPHSTKSAIIEKCGLCRKCLRRRHQGECRFTPSCIICKAKHQSFLCPRLEGSSNPYEGEMEPEEKAKVKDAALCNQLSTVEVPLQTLMATVYGTNGREKRVRVMFDSGSQRSYIVSSLAKELKLKLMGEEKVAHQLFGGQETKAVKHQIFQLRIGRPNEEKVYRFDVRAISEISSRIIAPRRGKWINEFAEKKVFFSDLKSDDGPIDVLLGNDVRAALFTGEKIVLGYGPIAEKTVWGWVLSGKLPISRSGGTPVLCSCQVTHPRTGEYPVHCSCKSVPSGTEQDPVLYSVATVSTSSMTSTTVVHMNLTDRPLSDLWSLDTIGIRDAAETQSRNEIEIAVQQHFDENVSRKADGRYEVALPWIAGYRERLPQNFDSALTRLKTTTKKLKNEDLFLSYDRLLQQWEQDDMIEVVENWKMTSFQSTPKTGKTPVLDNTVVNGLHYLPHRAVVKLSSATTPVRPVFDASAKPRGYPSLNDCVDKGPNMLELIPAILTRFRLNAVGAIADIKKAFQQISIRSEDRDCLRFLWWENENCENLKVYRHTRVVFGVSCSPYLLAATLRHHLQSQLEKDTARILQNNLYVDNCVVSLPTRKAAIKFQEESRNMLEPAQFDLRGWEFGPTEADKKVPVLGLVWNVKSDTLSLDLSAIEDCSGTGDTRFLDEAGIRTGDGCP